MADDSSYSEPFSKPHLPSIITTLHELREEDEDTVQENKIVASPLNISRSEMSLVSLVRSSSQHAPMSPSMLASNDTSMATLATAHMNAMHQPAVALKRRRNSFSSFLSKKYEKSAKLYQDQDWTPSKTSDALKTGVNDKKSTPSKEFQKGHRPRSYSELPSLPDKVERAPPVAITNKTPIYEYYGFVMYLATFVVFGLYIIWAYLPDRILHDLGITYYPSRYWALAIPTWLMVLVWFIFFYYVTYNMMNTPPFDTLEAITDEHAVIMAKDSIPPVAARPPDYMPELHDIPIAVVNTFLYQDPSVIPLSTRSSGHQRTASSSSSHQRTSSTSSLSGHQRTSSQSGHQRTSSSSSFTSTQGSRRR